MIINLDGLVFNDYEPDENGTFWYVTGFDGWDDTDVRRAVTTPTSRHGHSLANAHLEARQMTLSGVVKATGKTNYEIAKDQFLAQSNNIVQPKPLKVTETGVRTLRVTKAAKVRLEPAGLAAFTFELPLEAQDPVKRGPLKTVTVAAGDNVTLINDGNWVSERIVITAQDDGALKINNVAWGDMGLRSHRDLPDNAVIDVMARTVRAANNRPIYQVLSPMSAWWGLQPGENLIRNRSDMAVQIDYYDAWL